MNTDGFLELFVVLGALGAVFVTGRMLTIISERVAAVVNPILVIALIVAFWAWTAMSDHSVAVRMRADLAPSPAQHAERDAFWSMFSAK